MTALALRTTHTGSLPRPSALGTAASSLPEQVREVMAAQLSTGLSIINDGEFGRESYVTYVAERLSGFSGAEDPIDVDDLASVPEVAADLARGATPGAPRRSCESEIRYSGQQDLARDLDRAATCARTLGAADRLFFTAPSPGTIALFFGDLHYGRHEDYVQALADAMREEYSAIVATGAILQLDCPDLALGRHARRRGTATRRAGDIAEANLAALNRAVEGLPVERIRMHVCWGNYAGPHDCDTPLVELWPLLSRARPAGLMLEAANPRHAHEWSLFAERRLPSDKYLVPGVIETTNNIIEHPDLVAQRLENYVRHVGADRVLAGVDCGFSSFAGSPAVNPELCWRKLAVLVEGARRCSRRLGLGEVETP